MRNPFKSRHYFRLIDKIADLESERDALAREKDKIKQSLSPREYCTLSVRIADIQIKINLLRALL
jgi:hypothetical protein